MNYKNNNGNIIMSNASNNNNRNSNNGSLFNNVVMENANTNLRELNRVKADLKRAAREAVKNSTVLNTLVARIEGIGSNNHKKSPVAKNVSRKNALKIQRIIHPNKAMSRFKNVRNANLRNRIRRNVTETSALFQYY